MEERKLLLKIYSGSNKKHESHKKLLSHIMTEGTHEGLGQENALPLASQLTFVGRIHTKGKIFQVIPSKPLSPPRLMF